MTKTMGLVSAQIHPGSILSDNKKWQPGVPVVAQWLTSPTRSHEVAGSVPALAQWVKGSGIAAAAEVTAVAQIQSLAWECPHANSNCLSREKML